MKFNILEHIKQSTFNEPTFSNMINILRFLKKMKNVCQILINAIGGNNAAITNNTNNLACKFGDTNNQADTQDIIPIVIPHPLPSDKPIDDNQNSKKNNFYKQDPLNFHETINFEISSHFQSKNSGCFVLIFRSLRVLIISSPPKTPNIPSYFPPVGCVSRCDPT
mgnify:CR=1 FL=1